MGYTKRWPLWTEHGLALLERGSWTAAARADDALQDEWQAEKEAQRQERADRAERRRLNIAEQRLRVQDRLDKRRRRRERDGGGS